MSGISHVAIVGAGAFGTALALVAEKAGRSVTLFGRSADVQDRPRILRSLQRWK
jgi:glycerol-3-phosphate dehydrogenase (NAD(P)+)